MKLSFVCLYAIRFCPRMLTTPASLSRITERNLNPKAACLKRREEEKGDDIPHHLHPAATAGIPFNMNVTNVSHAVSQVSWPLLP